MIAEICVGGSIVLILLILVYLLLFSKPFTYVKRSHSGTTYLSITARKNLSSISVKAGDISFRRQRIKKGQTIEFDYPSSNKLAELTIELSQGNIQKFEV